MRMGELMTTEKEPMTHVWRKPCGCLRCAIVNVPVMFGELKKAHTQAKRYNYTYELMETQAVREMEWRCALHKKK